MNIFNTISTNLLLGVTISYGCGILASTISPFFHVPGSLILLALFATTATLFFRRIPGIVPIILLFTSCFLLGSFLFAEQKRTPDTLNNLTGTLSEKEEVILIGTVFRTYGFNGKTSSFDFHTSALRSEQTSQYRSFSGTIRLRFTGRLPDIVTPGNYLAVRAVIQRPYRYNTPGSFDYPAHLAQKDIYIVGKVISSVHFHKVTLPNHHRYKLRYIIESIRNHINSFIDKVLPGDTGAIYKALLTGDRTSISAATLEQFKATGCMHLLAISGLHVSLLGMILYLFFFWLLRRSTYILLHYNSRKIAIGLTIIPLLFYTLLAGGKIPVMRAFIMGMFIMLAFCSDRKPSPFTIISAAALIILLLFPGELYTASFQLTFAAVCFIVAAIPIIHRIVTLVTRPPLPKSFHKPVSWLIAAILVSTAATLGTGPFLLYHFKQISLVGVLTNIIVEPLLCLWSLTLGFMSLVFLPIQENPAAIMLQLGAMGIEIATHLLDFFYSPHYSSLFLPPPKITSIILYYLGTFPLLLLWEKRVKAQRVLCFFLLLSSVLLYLYPLTIPHKRQHDSSFIAVLDIGHGSCNLVVSPQGRTTLIDGGGLTSDRFNVGMGVIAPYLWQKKIYTIDDIIITHPDSDHYNGIPFILSTFNVSRLWLSTDKGSREWQQMQDLARRKGVQIIIPQQKTVIFSEKNALLQVLSNTHHNSTTQHNNNGLVLHFNTYGFSSLFPGDIPGETENNLVAKDQIPKANLLIASHHGSSTSNTPEFLKAVSPQYIIVSSGRSRKATFPGKHLITHSRRTGISLLPTHSIGSVIISIQKGAHHIDTPLNPRRLNSCMPGR